MTQATEYTYEYLLQYPEVWERQALLLTRFERLSVTAVADMTSPGARFDPIQPHGAAHIARWLPVSTQLVDRKELHPNGSPPR